MVFWQKSKSKQSDIGRLTTSHDVVSQADSIRRSAFALPQFLRKAWVSEAARLHLEPRIQQITNAWESAEWRSADSVRPCALVSILSFDHTNWMKRIESAGLKSTALRVVDITPKGASERVFLTDMVLGSRRNVKALRSAWINRDNETIGALLGYPPCCRALYQFAFVSRNFQDYTWLISRVTHQARVVGNDVSLSGLRETNILLRRIGVHAIPHIPCSFSCQASQQLSLAMTNLASSLGHTKEIEWLHDMLDWPIMWSARHGIAEIRTPVLKIATQTDMTFETYTARWLGHSIPTEAARGLDFPYLVDKAASSLPLAL